MVLLLFRWHCDAPHLARHRTQRWEAQGNEEAPGREACRGSGRMPIAPQLRRALREMRGARQTARSSVDPTAGPPPR